MANQPAPSVWDPGQYWLKAQSYVTRAQESSSDSPDYALWYALALEHLARAALCSFHPVLNADHRKWQNLFYGVGVVRTERPKSIPIHSVYERLVQLLDEFTSAHESFCGAMADRRNAELHSAELPFDGLRTQEWLARYYEVASILCIATSRSLEDLFGEDEVEAARALIEASKSDGLGKVKKKVADHQALFEKMPPESQSALQAAAAVSKKLPSETMARCPACDSYGQLEGRWLREGRPNYADDVLRIDVTYLSDSFKCSVCQLGLQSEEEIHFAGMQPTFTETQSTSLHEMLELEFENEYMNM